MTAYSYAQGRAIAHHARGDQEREREWLDLLHLLDAEARDDREGDLLSRLACVSEATYWDQPYETRIASIRGMCDLTTDGMTSAPMPSDEYDQESERVTAERAWQEGADWAYGRCYAGPVPAKFNPYAAPVAPDGGDQP